MIFLNLLLSIAFIALIFSVLVAYGVLSWAFVITKCWAWFLTVHFGLAAISMAQAICIVILAGLVKTLVNPEWDSILNAFDKTEPKEGNMPKWAKPCLTFAAPWLFLGFYWLIKIIFL